MKLLFSFIFLLIFSGAPAQTFEELHTLNYDGQYAEALAKARPIMKGDAATSYAYVIAGEAYFLQKNDDSGFYYMNEALKQDSDLTYVSGWAHAYIGQFYTRRRSKEVAIAELYKGTRQGMDKKSVAWSYEMLGELYARYTKNDSAITCFRQAIDIDNGNGWVSGLSYAYLGGIYNAQENRAEAETDLNKAIALNKGSRSVALAGNVLLFLLNDEKKYEEETTLAHKMIEQKNGDPAPYLALGNLYLEHRSYDTAIYYLQEAVKLDKEETWISGVGNVDLGSAYLRLGEQEKAVIALNKAIALDKTPNSVQNAQKLLSTIDNETAINYVALTPKWTIIESDHIRYYFQDTAGITEQVKKYILYHDLAYGKINAVLHAQLPAKISLYVWNDKDLAKKLLHHDLGFTDPVTYTTNVYFDQTIGHEMTHTLAYWAWGTKPVRETPFINEGVAVAFDQADNDKFITAQQAVAGKKIHSVLEVWKNEKANEDIVYSLGGAFLTYMYQNSTQDQFKALIKDQTIESAEKTYGKEQFNKMIVDFNRKIGLA